MSPSIKKALKVVVTVGGIGAASYYAPQTLPLVQQLLAALFGSAQ